ncbi:MAG: hypothetical protein ACT4PT_09690 [Methanobacteriota archaeon]
MDRMRRIVIVAVVAGLLAPVALAKTLAAPYNQWGGSFDAAWGSYGGEYWIEPTPGRAHVYARGLVAGGIVTRTVLGSTYTTNAGDLLSSFSAPTTASGRATGHFNCINAVVGGTEATLSLSLRKERWTGSSWTLEEDKQLPSWSCFFYTLVDEPFSGGASFTFAPARTYRLGVEATAKANALGVGTAIVDFCSTGSSTCGSAGESVTVSSISVPNQAPKARANAVAVWYPLAVLGMSATGRGCDIDGYVSRITVAVSGFGSTTRTGSSGCWNSFHQFQPLAPGTWTVTVTAVDNEGASATSTGSASATLLPLASSEAGALALPELPAAEPRRLELRAIVAADGRVVSAYGNADGTLLGDVAARPVLPGESEVVVTYDAVASQASVTVGGKHVWSGLVVKADPASWASIVPADTEVSRSTIGTNRIAENGGEETPTDGETEVTSAPPPGPLADAVSSQQSTPRDGRACLGPSVLSFCYAAHGPRRTAYTVPVRGTGAPANSPGSRPLVA